jgi:hypothetical protein
MSPPKIKAPGLILRRRKDVWAACWQARSDLVKRGFTPKFVTLAFIPAEPNEIEIAFVMDRCNALQAEMLVWGRGGAPTVSIFDGTLRALINCYQTDPDSPYRKVRYVTRQNYDSICQKLAAHCGDMLLADIKPRMFMRWHEEWLQIGVPVAHTRIGMMRTVLGFGATILEDVECQRLRGILHGMRFQMGQARKEVLTAEQVSAIRAKAHEMGFPMIALAQALQFELTLRQKDVIGEWIPRSEPGLSEVIHPTTGRKWLRGLRWDEIDGNLVIRHTTSKKGKDIEVDLRLAPMVVEEFGAFGTLPASGPIILNKNTGLPYGAQQFRDHWRAIADAAGIPKNVHNMDTRAGAITEGTDSGALLEDVRHAATHSNISMTQKYSRAQARKTANVMQLRAAHRAKTPRERND